jgi:hypothetical protein
MRANWLIRDLDLVYRGDDSEPKLFDSSAVMTVIFLNFESAVQTAGIATLIIRPFPPEAAACLC